MQMWVYLEDAAQEIPIVEFRPAFDRFISWTWPEHRVVVGRLPLK